MWQIIPYQEPLLRLLRELKKGGEMMSDNKNCAPLWNVLLGAAIAAAFMVLLFSITTEQNKSPLDLGLRIEGQVPPNCVCLNETKNAPTNNTEVLVSETKNAPTNKTQTTFEDLLPLLKNASMDDNTVIFTEVNDAFANPGSILDLFLESFHVGENIARLLDHLIIIAMDQVSFERCKSLHRHCYLFQIDGLNFESEKFYMTKGFVDLVWTKIKLMRQMVEFGYNVVFTDLDVLWLRNIFKFISVYYDITLSSDMYFGRPEDTGNFPNTGLFYVKSTAKNAEVLNFWYEARNRFPDQNEQSVFNEIKNELVDRFQVKMRFLETDYLSGFCNYGKDMNKVYSMQSNCCVGLANKLNDLRGVLDDWKKYMSLSSEEKNNGNFTWTIPRICLH
ncbi:nucleotide-diphospho-sugar transferase family protein [Rhynchospora pubera]|uniref:Nucleotide-diphospho-sugar transferase family protein n=1 Tax=Rhynchospora pubera TaxID=906938 RepID=A0AAV8ASN6_9POAL|nr:nucleotide-diphospho-sugar transferase family protein [Rhynchospora pubera]KAJ4778931.1 nucleotide-diphospho-sugar transferase family protein [Rhynchospora pubera]